MENLLNKEFYILINPFVMDLLKILQSFKVYGRERISAFPFITATVCS